MRYPAIRNRLLRALPAEELALCMPHIDHVDLNTRQVLNFKAMPADYCYFIEEGLVSVLAEIGDGKVVEVWLIGSEGLVGLPVLLGGATSPFRRVVAVPGHAFRIPADQLRRLTNERPVLHQLMLRYAQAVVVQSGQAGACASQHSISQRLARWLLSAEYRLGHSELPLTHALLSRLIGSRRATVTVALGKFEAAGLIEQRRGEIVVLNRDLLQEAACNCHSVIRAAYDRIAFDTDS